MRLRAHFVPGRDRRGRPVASLWSSRFNWRLPVIAAATDAPRPLPLDPQSWVTDEDYPPEAVRAGVAGTVRVRLDVDSTGATTACTILESSGASLLDSKACELLRVRARFRPARDGSGKAVASTWTARFTWRAPDKGEPEDRDGFAVTTYELKPDGEVISCLSVPETDARIEHDPCNSVARGQPPGWAAKYAPRFRILRLQMGSAEIETMPALPRREWGTLLARRLTSLAFNKSGILIGCTVLASQGPAEVRPDLCTSSRPAPKKSGVSRDVVFQVVDGWAIYGVPRVKP
jgi:TonB family protein